MCKLRFIKEFLITEIQKLEDSVRLMKDEAVDLAAENRSSMILHSKYNANMDRIRFISKEINEMSITLRAMRDIERRVSISIGEDGFPARKRVVRIVRRSKSSK